MKYLITILTLIILGCNNPVNIESEEETIHVNADPIITMEALFGNTYQSLDEVVPHTNILTTKIVFDTTNFYVYEDYYKFYPELEYLYTQEHIGEIYDTTNCDGYQVIHLNIRRISPDGTEVLGGYKDYRMYLVNEIIILVEVGATKKWNENGEVYYDWEPLRIGDTTYLQNIEDIVYDTIQQDTLIIDTISQDTIQNDTEYNHNFIYNNGLFNYVKKYGVLTEPLYMVDYDSYYIQGTEYYIMLTDKFKIVMEQV